MSDVSSVSLPALSPGVQIVGLIQGSEQNLAGQLQRGQQITIRIPGGAQATVFVANQDLGNTAAVAAVLNRKAAELTAVANLTAPQ